MAEVQDFAISHNTKFKLWQPHDIKNARLSVCKILDCTGAVEFGGPLNLAALCGRIARIMPKAGSGGALCEKCAVQNQFWFVGGAQVLRATTKKVVDFLRKKCTLAASVPPTPM